MAENLTGWRDRLRHRISQQIPPGIRHDDEVERRFQATLDFPVPSDDELVAMQMRGELPSDEELARDG